MMAVDFSNETDIIVLEAPSSSEVITIAVPGVQGSPGPQGAPGPAGPANVLTIGTVTTGAAGSAASATISGVAPNQTLNLTIPRGSQGDVGATPALSIGTITTLAEGQAATATLTGSTTAPILNLGIPRGYGVRAAGTTGQVLVKLSGTDHDTGWSTLTAASITDSGATGRALVTSADAAAARTALGITAIGSSVVTAADAAAVRTAIGAGTSNLVLGTTAGTAKEGNYQPTAANISDSTATGRSVLTATDAAAARTAIGAGTSSLVIGTTNTTAKAGDYQPAAANISDATTVGRSVLTAADAAAVRTAIGAGTSSLVIGTTAATAKAGNYQPTAANISDSTAVGRSLITATDAAAARTATGAAAASHTHAIADVTNLQTTLDSKAASSHTHGVSDLTATGTRDATTFLRGDNTWAAISASDTGWLTIPNLGTGFTIGSDGGQYRVVEQHCTISAHLNRDSGTRTGTMFTLPVGARPGRIMWAVLMAGGVNVGEVKFLTTGVVQLVTSVTTNTGTVLQFTFPVG